MSPLTDEPCVEALRNIAESPVDAAARRRLALGLGIGARPGLRWRGTGAGAPVNDGRALLRHWRAPLLLAVLLALLQVTGARAAMEYRRTAVLHGEIWRLMTSSLVHLGWVHLLRDLAGLFLIWGLFARRLSERTCLGVLMVSALVVGLGLLIFSPEIGWYVGISGALFGLFCAGALCELRTRPLYGGALLLGMAAIVGWTLYAGAWPDETVGLGGQVVPQAHLYGAVGGAACMLLRRAPRAASTAAQ